MNRRWLGWQKKAALLLLACLLIAAVLYSSVISCRVTIIDQGGNPVPDARVLVLHHHGLAEPGVLFGTTDGNGQVVFNHLTSPHPFGSLSLMVVSPGNNIGSANAHQWTRTISIKLRSRTAEDRKYYQYEKAENLWVISPVVKREIDWSIKPGIGKYIPMAELLAEEQRRLKRER